MSQFEFNMLNIIANYIERQHKLIHDEAMILGVSSPVALQIIYFREMSYWSQDREDYLILLAKRGESLPNIFEDFEIKPLSLPGEELAKINPRYELENPWND